MRVYCDASSLVSLSSSCLLNVLKMFPKTEFIIPKSVYKEAISAAEGIRKFKWNGLRIKELVDDNILKVSEALPEAQEFMNLSNNLFIHKNKGLKIIHLGEAECVGGLMRDKKGLLLVDERNTRMIIEAPEKLHEYLTNKLGKDIKINEHNLAALKDKVGWIPIIRSTELLALAYSLGFARNEEELEAALFSLKYAGCSITFEEIEEYIRIL